MATLTLSCLLSAVAYRMVRASYSRPCRESRYRGVWAALGAILGACLASCVYRLAVHVGDSLASVGGFAVAVALGAGLFAVGSLVVLIGCEDMGLKVPA